MFRSNNKVKSNIYVCGSQSKAFNHTVICLMVNTAGLAKKKKRKQRKKKKCSSAAICVPLGGDRCKHHGTATQDKKRSYTNDTKCNVFFLD